MATSSRSAPQCFDATEPHIVVEVGSPPKSFAVHESLLCSSSDFFKARQKPEWSRTGANIQLPDHAAETFNVYVNWLYQRCLPQPLVTFGSNDQETEWRTLAESYVLGEAILDTSFKDSIIDAMRTKIHSKAVSSFWPIANDLIKTIYDGTTLSSPAREFFVDFFAHHASEVDIYCTYGTPADFHYALALELRKKSKPVFTGKPIYLKPLPCGYHSHGQSEACYRDGK